MGNRLQFSAMNARLLITGGAGFLGTHLLQQAHSFTATGTLHRTAATSIPDVAFHVCDLEQTQEVKILLDRVRPEIIIHTAGSDQGGNFSAISRVAGLLAMQSAERYIRFIHLSTDQVFDGTAAPYLETSTPRPINPYGTAKAQSENLVHSLNPQALIVRTSLLYDLRSPDRQTSQLIHATTTGVPYRLFTDEFRCPIWVENLAEALLELAETNYAGILNLGGPQPFNRWEWGLQMLQHFGIPLTPNIQPGTIEESALIRPKNLTLDSTSTQQLIHTPLLSFTESCKKIE